MKTTRLILPHQYHAAERWLARQAGKGLRLTRFGGGMFLFAQSEPKEKTFLFVRTLPKDAEAGEIIRQLKTELHAQEVPGGRFSPVLLVLSGRGGTELAALRKRLRYRALLADLAYAFPCVLLCFVGLPVGLVLLPAAGAVVFLMAAGKEWFHRDEDT